jgi:hypothetical protein
MGIGEIIGDVYVTWRNPNQIFRLYHSFGISKSKLEELSAKGIEKIQFPVKDWNCIYEATVSQFLGSSLEFKDSFREKSKHVRLDRMKRVPF